MLDYILILSMLIGGVQGFILTRKYQREEKPKETRFSFVAGVGLSAYGLMQIAILVVLEIDKHASDFEYTSFLPTFFLVLLVALVFWAWNFAKKRWP